MILISLVLKYIDSPPLSIIEWLKNRLEVKKRDYVIQKLEEVLLLKDKLEKAIAKYGNKYYKCKEK